MEKAYQEAIDILSEAIGIDGDNHDAKFYRGLAYLDSGLLKEAIDDFNTLVGKYNSQITRILISIAYKRQNDIPSALKTLDECIEKH